MTHLFGAWKEFLRSWSVGTPGRHLMLFFDYDGTLTPIEATPQRALLSPQTRQVLKDLAGFTACSLVIISGRALADLKKKVGLEGIAYVGNHGLEIEDRDFHFEDPVPADFLSTLKTIQEKIRKRLAPIDGILIEDKGLTLSVHYRLANALKEPVIRDIVEEICSPFQIRHKIRIDRGKKVLELKPALDWNKGKAVLWLLHKRALSQGAGGVFAVYVGDDVTDEDAFKALQNKGATVFVGEPGPSHAQYYLKNPGEVVEFLNRLRTILKP